MHNLHTIYEEFTGLKCGRLRLEAREYAGTIISLEKVMKNTDAYLFVLGDILLIVLLGRDAWVR